MVGRSVVDSDGVELGYVTSEDPRFLVLGEGSSGTLRMGKRFIERIEDRIVLKGTAADIFSGLNVVDSQGEFVGIIRDTVEANDVLDSFIVEDEQGELVTIVLEDVRLIDEWLELAINADELEEGT